MSRAQNLMWDARAVNLPLSADDIEVIADHRVQGRSIVPAAVLLLHVSRRCNENYAARSVLKNIKLHRPIHGADISTLELWLRLDREPTTQRLRFEIFSADTVYVDGEIDARAAARDPSAAPANEESSAQHSGHWYRHLASLGNDFGKSLRLIHRIDYGSNGQERTVSAQLDVTSNAAALLDACFHAVLAGADHDGAHVLSSIEEIELIEPADATTCHVRYRQSIDSYELRADLHATNGDKSFMRARGVSFTRLDPLTHEAAVAAVANFTLDPLKEALDHLGRELRLTLDLGPYDQICQTLMAPSKGLSSAGLSELFVFIRLQAWWRQRPLARGTLHTAAVSRGATPRVLPNGLEILELNGYETEHLYREIFDDDAYLGAGIALREGDTVLDIGANIGMFALHVVETCPTARVVAFEPSPITAAVLRANLEGRGAIQVREQGVGRARGRAIFRHYEKSSVFSGYAAQPEVDARAIRSIVAELLNKNGGREADIDRLMQGRVEGTDFDTEIVGVSDVIDELQLAEIGLLKIDAEKSEFAILDGIRDEHWSRIRQIVLELHQRDAGDLPRVQSMLMGRGFRVQIRDDDVLARAGLHTVLAWRDQGAVVRSDGDGLGLREPLDALVAALRVFREQCDVTTTIVVTPDSQACRDSTYISTAHRSAVERLGRLCATIPGVQVASWQDIAACYPLDTIDGSAVEEEAGIPYERSWYAAAAAWLLRRHVARVRRPHKVIVVDCDDTLWDGNCAQSDITPIRIGARHRALQEWLVAKRRDGWLICLSSKNCEADVLRAFEQHSDMPLSLADVVAHRVSWERKSTSIVELARELNIAVEDFILIDNNEVECAEVAARCPGVLTLRLPERDRDVRTFLDHVWAFDRAAGVRAVDRTGLYQAEQRRCNVRAAAGSFREFLDSLQLQVTIEDIVPADLPRVSELTLRTNQFNLNRQPLTAPELARLLQDRRHRGWVVRAADRFGDYGCVGVVLAQIDATSLLLTTVLLSCRVLGRGIEFRLVQFLVEAAKAMHLGRLRFLVTTTARNAPALNFIRALPVHVGARLGSDSLEYELDVADASTLYADQFDQTAAVAEDDRAPLGSNQRAAVWDERYRDSEWLLRMMRWYSSANDIAASVWGADESSGAFALEDGLAAVAAIWSRVLRRRVDDPDLNFFALGGTSLQLVRVLDELNRTCGVRLSLAQIYAAPTVRSMHALSTGQADTAARKFETTPSATSIAISAGQQALWFLYLAQPRSTIYNVPIVLWFTGQVDESALRDALLRVVVADPVLGTTYSLHGKDTLATACHAAAIDWSVIEGSVGDEGELLDCAEDWARASLDLRAGPAMRARFFKRDPSQSALMILTHHIAADFDSMALLVEKISAAYTAGMRNRPVTVSVDTTFETFARSESNYLREHGARLEQLWRQELSGAQPRELPLPIDASIGSAASGGDGVLILLSHSLTHRVRARAEALGVSRLTLFMAAYACFIRLESGAQQIQIGTPISLRSRGDFARAIGNFVNVIPLQLRLAGAATSDEVVTITRDTLQRAVAAADLPLQRILRQAPKAGSVQILGVQTTLAFHEARGDWPAVYMLAHRRVSPMFAFANEVRARVVGLRQQAGYCDIALDILELDDGLAVDVKFATAKFTRQTAESWGRRFVAFLERTL